MRHVRAHQQSAIGQAPEARRGKRYVSLGASLGLRARQIDTLIEEVQTGLSFKALASFSSESGMAISEVASLVELPQRTLARRKVVGKLSPEESERLLRLSNIFEKAVGLFEGNVEAAVAWLRSPKRALGYKAPLTYLRTEIGARQVEDLIGSLEHGVFA